MEIPSNTGTPEQVPDRPKLVWVGPGGKRPEEPATMPEIVITRDVFERLGADLLLMQIVGWIDKVNALIDKIEEADRELERHGFRREGNKVLVKADGAAGREILARMAAARQSYQKSLGTRSSPEAGSDAGPVVN